MDQNNRLVVAMAERCRQRIVTSKMYDPSLPISLQPAHLKWMCDQIVEMADLVPATRLHRWMGFVQCGMLANRMIDTSGVRAMLQLANAAIFDADQALEDLIDHLDPTNTFELDIGGEG